jgi:hypothetical protein
MLVGVLVPVPFGAFGSPNGVVGLDGGITFWVVDVDGTGGKAIPGGGGFRMHASNGNLLSYPPIAHLAIRISVDRKGDTRAHNKYLVSQTRQTALLRRTSW